MTRLAAAILAVLATAAPAAARTGCFTYVTGANDGWGSITQVCPMIDRPREPGRPRLR
jgi:hypothetical protein